MRLDYYAFSMLRSALLLNGYESGFNRSPTVASSTVLVPPPEDDASAAEHDEP